MQDREELWRTGEDHPVEVDQRALIDKVLARYPGEFTVFRELLQNSDDAQSHEVEIHFDTAEYLDGSDGRGNVPILTDLKSAHVVQWTFKNNGAAFTEHDWTRLPRIAEGNPGPEKIGAFGVGFYSIFSVTERPFVSSGGYGMQFYWKDNQGQLYFRRGKLRHGETPDPWTRFEMPLREIGLMPPPLEFLRFLATSITFMVHLRGVRVFVDGHCIGRIQKLRGPIQRVGIPGDLRRSSPRGIMNVKEIQCHPITIEAEVAHAVYATTTGELPFHPASESHSEGSFFSSNEPLPQLGTPSTLQSGDPRLLFHRSAVCLSVFTAVVKVELDEKLSVDLLRCTKKALPSRLTYGLIYTGKDEYDRSITEQNHNKAMDDSIFQGLRADLNGATHTRIFIGHATGQTTGVGGHMASYFIPTVERESIDLIDRNIAIWNSELLYVGGFLCRAVYDLELSRIQNAWEGATGLNDTIEFCPPVELQDSLHRRFLHTLRFFTFRRSTPSAKVTQLLETAFYACSTTPLRLLSSAGVRTAPEIKEYDLAFAKFLKYLPMLPHYVAQECPGIIEKLPDEHKILRITFSDVLQDLHRHPLTQEELAACLRWWASRKDNSSHYTARLLSAITLCSANGTLLRLSSVKYFIGSESLKAHIPLDGPLPATLIPHDITTKFALNPMDLASFGWREFTVVDWLRHVSRSEIMSADSRYDFTRSIEWAERVLIALSGVWSTQSEKLYSLAKSIFGNRNCIPTSHGLCSPEESFLSSTNSTLFRDLDLPIVQFSSALATVGDIEDFLSSIGVREHVPPQLLLGRMVETGNWSTPDLVAYLVQVQNALTPDEFLRLKSFKAFTREGEERSCYCALDLYPPMDIFRQLQLPVIDWGEKSRWRDDSDQAELLYRLGLRRYPSLETIVRLSSTPQDSRVRETAFEYLCDNLRSKYAHYNPDDFRYIAFIPAENMDRTYLAKLGDVFLSIRWKSLGFSVIQNSFRKAPLTELGVQQHPPTSMLIQLLETAPPAHEGMARQWFECLLECIPSFSQRELTELSGLHIVPTRSSVGLQYLTPSQCYLGEGDGFHSKLFNFVDFGDTANHFLRACGSKNEPSVKDIAESLVRDPERFYNLAGGYEGFLAELRDLAAQSRRIPNATISKMITKSVLVGVRRKKTIDGDESEYERALRKPWDILIADDMDSYQLFADTIFVSPQDSGLEAFYAMLGSRRLSTLVEEKYKATNELLLSETPAHVRSLILQRLPLFLRGDTRTQIQVPVSLLSAENFTVKICERLVVSKTLTIGNDQTTRNRDVWAATKRDDKGRVELWLSGNEEPDMYEIATSLCRLLFGTAKIGDTLLLATILSTPLEILRRRGYNVDKQNEQWRGDAELREEVIDNHYMLPQVTTVSATNNAPKQSIMTTSPGSIATNGRSSTDRMVPDGSQTSGNTPSLLHNPVEHRIPIRVSLRRFVSLVRFSETARSTLSPLRSRTPRQVVPQSYIRACVGKAMKASNPEERKLLHHHSKVEEIREFSSIGYCDTSGQASKLKLCGEIGHTEMLNDEISFDADVPNSSVFITRMHGILTRFVNILTPVAELYGLSLRLLHIFYDVGGWPIAFNQNGSIFLNLRYFEAWHDQDVQKGDLQQAQVSWFFALAHELAHNLIKQHNSDHEFWFSAICEAHILALSQLLVHS